MAQEQGEKNSSREVENNSESQMSSEASRAAIASADQQERATESMEDIDGLLDAIDDVLEENAETFMDAFVQKGGQ